MSGLRVFGSVARGEDRPDSDVDLLADSAPPGMSLFGLGAREQADLETIVGTRVDLVPAGEWLKPDVAPPCRAATW